MQTLTDFINEMQIENLTVDNINRYLKLYGLRPIKKQSQVLYLRLYFLINSLTESILDKNIPITIKSATVNIIKSIGECMTSHSGINLTITTDKKLNKKCNPILRLIFPVSSYT